MRLLKFIKDRIPQRYGIGCGQVFCMHATQAEADKHWDEHCERVRQQTIETLKQRKAAMNEWGLKIDPDPYWEMLRKQYADAVGNTKEG